MIAYSLKGKEQVKIVGDLKLKKYQLPNGNIVSIICGKDKKTNIVCTIVTNEKLKQCKNNKSRTKNGAKCKK